MSFITIGGSNNSTAPASPQALIAALIWGAIKLFGFLGLAAALYYTWAGRIEDKALQEQRHVQVTKDLKTKEDQLKRLQASGELTRVAMESFAKGSDAIRKQTSQRVNQTEAKVKEIVDDPSKTEEVKDKEIATVYANALREQQCQANPSVCKPASAASIASKFFNLQNFTFPKAKP